METVHEPRRHDLRRNDRRPCDHTVKVMWSDLRGQEKFFLAKALDIGGRGLRIRMPEALPPQSLVALSASKLGLVGHATVRHCTRTRSSHYAIGVEFTTGLKIDFRTSV